jgi:hypothetical protein
MKVIEVSGKVKIPDGIIVLGERYSMRMYDE